jgi:hypothetical protein
VWQTELSVRLGGSGLGMDLRGWVNSRLMTWSASTIVVTVVAGPLDYFGVSPKVKCPSVKVPQPSK